MNRHGDNAQRWVFFFVLLAVLASLAPITAPAAAANDKVVRLAVVNTPAYSGLMSYLLKDFQANTGITVEVYSGKDVYDVAQAGKADIVISHFGKAEVEQFVLDGYGRWPVIVFSNQSVVIGPKSDPANIRELSSATEAFRRIAKAKSPFIVNQIPGVFYLTEILGKAAGWPERAPWVHDESVAKARAVRLAEQRQAYVIWGALPFLRYKKKKSSTMEILVSADPILQRIMASVIVNPNKIKGVNAKGAKALQEFLLAPETQAKIAAYHTPGSNRQLWWSAGRDN